MEWKHSDSPVKKMFRVQQSVKEVTLTVFWAMKGLISIDFLVKGATVKSSSYCQFTKFIEQFLYKFKKKHAGGFQWILSRLKRRKHIWYTIRPENYSEKDSSAQNINS